jgi:cell wall-associated NlpC family hydrolase
VKRALLTIVAASLLSPLTARAAATGPAFHRHHPAAGRPRTLGARAARFSLRFRGTPYVWAGTTPRGFDCSGFTRFVYAHMGIELPHSSYAQWAMGRHVGRHALRPGDLVFFDRLGHVGLWIGRGRFIHAPQTGDVVSVASLSHGWYAAAYSGAVRLRGTQRSHRARRHQQHAVHLVAHA